jgi:hypothetical protein
MPRLVLECLSLLNFDAKISATMTGSKPWPMPEHIKLILFGGEFLKKSRAFSQVFVNLLHLAFR